MSSTEVQSAKVVVIGGGIMGCSVLYHLAHEGWTDCVLFEKAELTSGSTWHAVGLITHSLSSFTIGKMAGYGIELYQRIEEETGQSVSFNNCGSLRLAHDEDDLDWLKYIYSLGQTLGHPMELIGPKRIRELHPFYDLEGVIAAIHTPKDGHVDPAGATFALAKGATQLGAKIYRDTRVLGMEKAPNGQWLVETEQGVWQCDMVVNAAGSYARQIGQWVGLELPIANLLHHYIVTDEVPEFGDLDRDLPVLRDDKFVSGYVRMEQKSGLIGVYEKENPQTVWDETSPWEAVNKLFPPDYERIGPWIENAFDRMPVMQKAGIMRAVHGIITAPPDGSVLLGPAPGVENYWCACAMPVGIAWGPGAGKYLVQWMIHGSADISMRAFDPRRFGPYADLEYAVAKGKEDYYMRHDVPFPGRDRPAHRPNKTSGLYEILQEKGAIYEEAFGWERPLWFAPPHMPREHIHSFRRTEVFEVVRAEAKALREHAAIADMTAFAKIDVKGPDAYTLLDRLCATRIPKKVGKISLGYLLTENGRIEFEASITKMAEDHYYLVAASFKELSLRDWLTFNKHSDEQVQIENVSSDIGVLALAGPKSRQILAQCTDAALDSSRFPWLTAQFIDIAGTTVRALRVSYVGDLGWELHVPIAKMAGVYAVLWAAGESEGLVHTGLTAFNALRMEKAYPASRELTNEVTMVEAGLNRFVKPTMNFKGAAITHKQLKEGAKKWQLAYLELDDARSAEINADPIGTDPVYHNGEKVGSIASAGYGYTIGKPLAFAYIKPELAVADTALEVMVLGDLVPAVVLAGPMFDPKNARMRG